MTVWYNFGLEQKTLHRKHSTLSWSWEAYFKVVDRCVLRSGIHISTTISKQEGWIFHQPICVTLKCNKLEAGIMLFYTHPTECSME
jgi:hypothetical protein